MKMDRMGLRTRIILLVVLSSSLEYLNSDSNCLKYNSFIGILYRCHKESEAISLFISSRNQVTLDCIDWPRLFVDKEILPKLNLTESISFELKDCYLNVSLYEIFSEFNMNKVKYFNLSFLGVPSDKIITNVTKEMFEHMESIEYLKLEDGMLKLSVNFLENIPNLRELSLQNNRLTQISKYFNHVPKLESLDLSTNEIDFIPDGVFENLGNLVELKATHNNLTSITKNTFNGLKSLKTLWLTNNHIENIEEGSFADMHKIVEISLQSNNIQETYRHLFKSNKLLENIKLGHNKILVLPDYLFANLTSLQTVELSFNNLREIPEHTFSNCFKLRYLTLKENHLSIIPEKTFLNLASLETLDISNNLFETLSDQLFSSLDNLEKLFASNNHLTTLDSDIFHKMGKLKILNLSRNNIGFIHLLAFRGLKDSLIHLDLSDNRLNSTYRIGDITPFHECPNLEVFILRKNAIKDYNYILNSQPSLKMDKSFNSIEGPMKRIDLSSNHIKDLRVTDFISTNILNLELNLTHNEIQYVNFQVSKSMEWYLHEIKPFTGRKIIHLYDNPIVCDCSNIDLIRYNNNELEVMKTRVDIMQDKLTCSEDKKMLVTNVKPNQIGCPVFQGCPSPCTCTYKPYNAAIIVDCSFNNLTSYPEFSFNETKYQQTILNLSGNHLNAGPVENSNYENVTHLDLSQNHISEMSWIPPNIKELNLKDNHLRKLDSHFVDLLKNRTYLKQFNLENNSWDCNCDASDLQRFLILNYDKVKSSSIYCHNSKTQLIKLTDLCKTSALLTVLLPIVFTILLCFTVALALYYRYQKEIKVYLYAQNLCLWFVTEEELDKDKTYDVFISYAHQDENFVLDYLLPELEHGQTPFKVCVHMRDWVPGELITTQIINTVKDSRRTLVVLSNNFVDSMWGKLEFRTAHTEAISEGRARVVVVIYGELNEDKLDDELKCYIKTNTYVKWGDKYFWNKLKYALPHSRQQVKRVVQTDEDFDLITTPPSPKNTSTSLVISDLSL